MSSQLDTSPQKRITQVFADLSPKQRRLAQYLLDNLYVVAFESANELASKVGVSPATVVRFCQGVGYAGYPEFQYAVRATLPVALTAAERGEKDISTRKGVPSSVVNRVFNAEKYSLQRTEMAVDSAELEAAAEALARARRVLVVGSGISASMATHLTHGLYAIGVDAVAVLAGGVPLATALARLDEKSVLVSLGVWRYVKSVVNAMVLAKDRGACCIAVTDSPVSPLIEHADHAFIAPTEGVAHTLSMAGTFALINAILVVVSHMQPARTVKALRDVDKAYGFGDLLLAH